MKTDGPNASTFQTKHDSQAAEKGHTTLSGTHVINQPDYEAAGFRSATLVLGGARSGKSRHAESLIMAAPGPWIYLATGQAYDSEMQSRIERHQSSRPTGWQTVEEPIDVAAILTRYATSPLLLDCLTLWLTNLLLEDHDIPSATDGLLRALVVRTAPTVLVGNEVGLGIVPENRLARRFRDEAGFLHQRIAAKVAHVLFVAAGLPLTLKKEQ